MPLVKVHTEQLFVRTKASFNLRWLCETASMNVSQGHRDSAGQSEQFFCLEDYSSNQKATVVSRQDRVYACCYNLNTIF